MRPGGDSLRGIGLLINGDVCLPNDCVRSTYYIFSAELLTVSLGVAAQAEADIGYETYRAMVAALS